MDAQKTRFNRYSMDGNIGSGRMRKLNEQHIKEQRYVRTVIIIAVGFVALVGASLWPSFALWIQFANFINGN